jgi:hypothetical protein
MPLCSVRVGAAAGGLAAPRVLSTQRCLRRRRSLRRGNDVAPGQERRDRIATDAVALGLPARMIAMPRSGRPGRPVSRGGPVSARRSGQAERDGERQLDDGATSCANTVWISALTSSRAPGAGRREPAGGAGAVLRGRYRVPRPASGLAMAAAIRREDRRCQRRLPRDYARSDDGHPGRRRIGRRCWAGRGDRSMKKRILRIT